MKYCFHRLLIKNSYVLFKSYFCFLQNFPKMNSFSILLKRSSCLFSTHERLKFAFNNFWDSLSKHENMIHSEIDRNIPSEWIHAIHTLHFMRMMHTFTRGWEESEFFIVLAQLDKNFEMTTKISQVKYSINLLILFAFQTLYFRCITQKSCNFSI